MRREQDDATVAPLTLIAEGDRPRIRQCWPRATEGTYGISIEEAWPEGQATAGRGRGGHGGGGFGRTWVTELQGS